MDGVEKKLFFSPLLLFSLPPSLPPPIPVQLSFNVTHTHTHTLCVSERGGKKGKEMSSSQY